MTKFLVRRISIEDLEDALNYYAGQGYNSVSVQTDHLVSTALCVFQAHDNYIEPIKYDRYAAYAV